jgi:nucleotide-binding universal stress UspA family protein
VAQDPALASAATGFDLPGGPYKQLLDAERQSAFALLLRAASQTGRPHRVELVSEVGDPAAEIHGVAEREHAGMIIVGSPGQAGLHRAVHGGLPRRLAAHAGCPVAVISGAIPERTITAPGAEANGRHVGAADLAATAR